MGAETVDEFRQRADEAVLNNVLPFIPIIDSDDRIGPETLRTAVRLAWMTGFNVGYNEGLVAVMDRLEEWSKPRA